MRQRASRAIYLLLGLYVAISLAYEVCACVSLIVGYWNLRHQVEGPFGASQNPPRITSLTPEAKAAGLKLGDVVESLNGVPMRGYSQYQSVRWHAGAADKIRVGVRRKDGSHALADVSLVPIQDREISFAEGLFMISIHVAVPFVCLLAGYWVIFARPRDPHAWLILILLTYPSVFVNVSTFNWWPEWLVLRLYWHLWIEVAASSALVLLGLLFPERSRIDRRVPWLKWLVVGIFAFVLVSESVFEYVDWYNNTAIAGTAPYEAALDRALQRYLVFCLIFYWIALFDQLRTTAAPDSRRRLRVLCAGSIVGLGSALIIWAVLPLFRINPEASPVLIYASAVLLMAFPFSLAYVVIVQRAMDVSILVRMGTRYLLARASLLAIQVGVIAFLLFHYILPVMERHQGYGNAVIMGVFVAAMLVRVNFVKRGPGERAREWLDRKFFREQYNAEQVLGELAERVRKEVNPAAMIELICSRISDVMHVPQLAVMVRQGDVFTGIAGGALALPAGSPPVRHLAATSSPAVLYRDRPAEWFEQAASDEKQALQDLNAEVLIPLPGRDRLMGVMILGPKRSEEPYSPTDLKLLQWVAVQAGMGLEVNELAQSLAAAASRQQRMQREVEIAREVQERLFPQQIPAVPGVDLAGHCRPALEVGGDYYDMIPLQDGRLALAVGDVSGKGIGAALLMASLRASLRGMTADKVTDLAVTMKRLNGLVYESSTSNRYATFFFAVYDPHTRELKYVNGGHNPPFVLRGNESIPLEACGPVVGLLPEIDFEERSLQMMPGDVFLGYTDGISEAMTIEDEEWGEERLLAATPRGSCASEILKRIFEAADAFTRGAPQHDDMTVLVMKLG